MEERELALGFAFALLAFGALAAGFLAFEALGAGAVTTSGVFAIAEDKEENFFMSLEILRAAARWCITPLFEAFEIKDTASRSDVTAVGPGEFVMVSFADRMAVLTWLRAAVLRRVLRTV